MRIRFLNHVENSNTSPGYSNETGVVVEMIVAIGLRPVVKSIQDNRPPSVALIPLPHDCFILTVVAAVLSDEENLSSETFIAKSP